MTFFDACLSLTHHLPPPPSYTLLGARSPLSSRPSSSGWYFPLALQLNTHNRLLLFDDSYERAGTIGFRCVADAPAPSCTAPLCGSFAPSPARPDLTAEGRGDWVHWGLDASEMTDRKRGIKPVIGNATIFGRGQAVTYDNNPTAFTWSDGTPTLAVNDSTTGAYNGAGIGNGFSFTVPVGRSNVTLSVYLGVYQAQGRLTARLTSGAMYTDDALWNPDTTFVCNRDVIPDACSLLCSCLFVAVDRRPDGCRCNGVYRLRVAGQGANDVLTIQWVQTNGDGNVTLQAATIA